MQETAKRYGLIAHLRRFDWLSEIKHGKNMWYLSPESDKLVVY